MLRMALIALLMAGVPHMGATDVSAASGKTNAEKSAKRKAEKRHGSKSENRIAKRPKTDSSRENVYKKKKNEESTTVVTRVREFNRGVYKVARRGAEWVNPYARSRHNKNSYNKRKYHAPERSHLHRRGCTAAAKKRFGIGRRLRGISAHKYGSRACRRALKRCRRELRRHKSSGRNPYARCVIVYRG